MTLDKFKRYIGYNNPKAVGFLMGIVFINAIDHLVKGEYGFAAVYGVVVLVNLFFTENTNVKEA